MAQANDGSAEGSSMWDEKFENAMLLFVGKGTPAIHREGYRNDLGNLCTGKTQGYWDKGRALAEARKRDVPAVDVRDVEDLANCAWDSPLLAQHPDKVDDYQSLDDLGSLGRATPGDYMDWWESRGAAVYNADELPDWD